METKRAKDFLVEQAAEQAAIESLPLGDLERRMMYFTESDPASCPDPVALNDEFEAQFDTPEYEAKMLKLLDHAYKRLRNEDPERVRNWDEAVSELLKGDHYILVLLGLSGDPASLERPKHDFLKLIGAALIVIAGFMSAALAADRFHIEFRYLAWPLVVLLILVWTGFSRPARLLFSGFFARRKRR
jgi:hypothetical protein